MVEVVVEVSEVVQVVQISDGFEGLLLDIGTHSRAVSSTIVL